MKKLFAIRRKDSKAIVANLFFGTKPQAKAERDKLTKENNEPFVVTYGPDHDRFKRA